MRRTLLMILLLGSIFLQAQEELNHQAQKTSSDYCDCVNTAFQQLDKDVVDLILLKETKDKFEFLKILNRRSHDLQDRFKLQVQIYQSDFNRFNCNECKMQLIDELSAHEINIIDSNDHAALFKKKVVDYLSYDIRCKLARHIFVQNYQFETPNFNAVSLNLKTYK